MKRLSQEQKVVLVITVHAPYGVARKPSYKDFNSPLIKAVTPCIKVGDSYCDLRNGKTVPFGDKNCCWPVLVGTVLNYPNGERYLISRSSDKERAVLVLSEEDGWVYNPASMTSVEVFKKEEKE